VGCENSARAPRNDEFAGGTEFWRPTRSYRVTSQAPPLKPRTEFLNPTRFGGDLLLGNFGDGQINAYEELANGQFAHRGELRGSDSKPLTIDGRWALRFGNGGNAGPTGTLFFTAGSDEESHGLFGSITAD
jgi:uncharacterized protein (TIGR03118 family)